MSRLGLSHALDVAAFRLAAVQRVTFGAERAVNRAADVFLDALGERLNRPGSGRIYPSRTGQGTHQASAPGEPPAPDRGKLRDSRRKEDLGNGVVRVVVQHEAADVLEYGSRDGKLQPRPYMRPTLDENQRRMTGAVVSNLRGFTLTVL